jgi:hypothetical protein
MYETTTLDTGFVNGVPPALFQSQDTVGTIGSMNNEFVELMQSTQESVEDILNFDDLDLRLSSKDFASLDFPEAEMPEEVLDEDCMSDDSSLFSGAPEPFALPSFSRTIGKSGVVTAQAPRKTKNSVKKSTTTKPRIRKNYEVINNESRVYVRYTDSDVLCQRGGLANRHPGNQQYLKAKDVLQPTYFAASKTGRTKVAQDLVDQVHAWGGRFLRFEKGCGWYEIHNLTARTKASQVLREDYTPEQRKEKRERHRANNRVTI